MQNSRGFEGAISYWQSALPFRENAFGFGNLPLLYLFFEESINVCHGNLGIDRVESFIIWIPWACRLSTGRSRKLLAPT